MWSKHPQRTDGHQSLSARSLFRCATEKFGPRNLRKRGAKEVIHLMGNALRFRLVPVRTTALPFNGLPTTYTSQGASAGRPDCCVTYRAAMNFTEQPVNEVFMPVASGISPLILSYVQ